MSKRKETLELSARERRRQRRIRNQICAYVTVVILLVLLGTGAFFGIRQVTERLESRRHEKAMEEQMAAMKEQDAMQEEEMEEEETEEYTEEDLLDEMVDAGIAEMSLADKAAGLFLTTPEELTGVGKAVQAGKKTEEALSEYAIGGLVYAASNVQSEDQFKKMLTDTLPKSKYPLFLIFDDKKDALQEDLSVYGINMEFADKGEDTDAMTFSTCSLPSLSGEDAGEDGLVTAQISAEKEEIADACLSAWENGADLLYVPENFFEAYDGLLEKIQEDDSLSEKLKESLERIYRVKYKGRLEE